MRLRSVLAGLLVLGALGVPAAEAGSRPGVAFRDAAGIDVLSTKRLSDREHSVRVLSPALGRPVDIRVLLPKRYEPGRRYPVLYLFHGTSGRASDWVERGDARRATADVPVITVMPDAGFDGNGGGWFTDWVDTTTALGPSRWETFHVGQVVPWVDRNLRTVASRKGRAVAGLSQGGFGAMTYAARHPDLFASVGSFSGAPEIDRDPETAAGATAVISATNVGLNGVQPDATFGPRATHQVNWMGHDPATIIENLRWTGIHLWTATGANGPYDEGPNPGGTGIEALTHQSSLRFQQHLVEAGIESSFKDYVFGTHTWAYWARDLREYLPAMLRDLAAPRTPRAVSYTSVDRRFAQWGWSVRFDRRAEQELSVLSGAAATGFALRGSGTATVVTPPLYRPGSTLQVTGGTAGTVGRDGRLAVTVELGPLPTTARVTVTAP